MKNYNSVKIEIEKPSWRQKIIIASANFLLWLIPILFKNDEKKIEDETIDVIKSAYKALKNI